MNNFSELSVAAPLKSNLSKHGFTVPTPVQAAMAVVGLIMVLPIPLSVSGGLAPHCQLMAHAWSSMRVCVMSGSMRRQCFGGKALDSTEQQFVQALVGAG